MPIALLTTYLAPYRVPLFERLAARHDIEVLCFGGGERYVPPWFADLDAQLRAAPFPARRLSGPRDALALGRRYDTVIGGFAGGTVLPAAYAGAKIRRRPFVLWASVWARPRSLTHDLAFPATRHIYRHADAVIVYGAHVRRFVASMRGCADDVFVAPQSVEPEFGREVSAAEIDGFRSRHGLGDGDGPIVLYAGRLVPEKGIPVLLDAWRRIRSDATLILVGDGPLALRAGATPGARLLGPIPRAELPVAYAAAELAVLPSVPTARFREPWGLVCNEAMLQGRPVIATTAVGAVAGGLVRDGESGLVVPAGDAVALAGAIDLLLSDHELHGRLGTAARDAVAPYTYDAMVRGFDAAIHSAIRARPSR